METKTYTLQGKEYKSKKVNLKLRNETFKLIKKFTNYSQDYIKDSTIKLAELEFGSPEYTYYQTQQNNDISLAAISFLSDEDNLKELFTKVLDGDVSSINYEAETDEAYWELITFGSEILNDFFNTIQAGETSIERIKKLNPAGFEEDDNEIPDSFNFDDELNIDYIIHTMSNGQPCNYQYIAETYDIEDFFKFVGFENRKANIEKYLMDNSSSDTPKEKENKVSFTDPQKAYKYFQQNKK